MKTKNIVLALLGVGIVTTACKPTTIKEEPVKVQAYQEHSPTKHHAVALEVLAASKAWIQDFNKANAEACVNGYTEKAIMHAAPFGVKQGKEAIAGFWKPFIASGATNLIYTNVSVEVANDSTAFLAANWSMNVGEGKIYQEKWEKKANKWLLSYDDFQVLEQYKTPKENTTNPIASHLQLEEVIKASMAWTKGFNTGKATVCAEGYTTMATMNAVPFASINGKEKIAGFWVKLITDGATNLTYHNPVFKVLTPNTVILASSWSMNIGEGKIYQEKWEKEAGAWKLSYDEFEVLKQY